MPDSKRHDVVRNQFQATTRAANRAIGNDIYCCVNQNGAYLDGMMATEVCVLDEIIVDDYYRRIFLSATLTGATGDDPFGLSMSIIETNTNLLMIPTITSHLKDEPKTITAAVDVPPGTYRFVLSAASVNYGQVIVVGESSLQGIVGQVVPTQQCFRTSGGCG